MCIYKHERRQLIVHPESLRTQCAFASKTLARLNVFLRLIKNMQQNAHSVQHMNACVHTLRECLFDAFFLLADDIDDHCV